MQAFFFLFHMKLMLLAGISRLREKSILYKGSITTITKITRASAFLPPARVICLLQLREICSAVIRIVRNLRAQ